MAKKKSKAKKIQIFAPIIRGLSSIWRFVSKILGSAVRFIFRSSKELDLLINEMVLPFLFSFWP